MKRYDVIALGELLIDFTMNGKSQQENDLYEANPGGAPCNVLAILSKLGKATAFIGKVGNDAFGNVLYDSLEELGISTEGLVKINEVPTTLAFVHTKEDGDRTFSFYRNPGADMMLMKNDIKSKMFDRAKIFHFGSLSMTDMPAKEATECAIALAKEKKMLVSFDPNFRPALWNNLDNARSVMAYGMKVCDVLKIADDEITFFCQNTDLDACIQNIKSIYKIPLILVTLGKRGSIAYTDKCKVISPPFIQNKVVDTTGAGDTFMGCVLNYILEKNTYNFSNDELSDMLSFANAAASLITTKKGALRVMPERQEIDRLLSK
ncbi:MAG: carbohydrate kinase [Cellulosilyticum sp.]|nr:carbohydrate kinase [Cellulosilyticum sp.]